MFILFTRSESINAKKKGGGGGFLNGPVHIETEVFYRKASLRTLYMMNCKKRSNMKKTYQSSGVLFSIVYV